MIVQFKKKSIYRDKVQNTPSRRKYDAQEIVFIYHETLKGTINRNLLSRIFLFFTNR